MVKDNPGYWRSELRDMPQAQWCTRCGALVMDTTLHDQFHEKLRVPDGQ